MKKLFFSLGMIVCSFVYGNIYQVKVPITIFSNYPGAFTYDGHTLVGHAWIGGVDEHENPFCIGVLSNRVSFSDYKDSFCSSTAYFTVWVTPEKQLQARNHISKGSWSFFHNCVDYVLDVLDIVGYPHPSRVFFRGILTSFAGSSPTEFYKWVNNEKTHVNPRFALKPEDQPVRYTIN
jgi:hypothetical protein